MTGIENQIVQAVTGLLAASVTAAIAYVSPRAKRWIATHTTAKAAGVAMTVIDGISTIADGVVADFNQRVVADAKAAGTWSPALAASVKQDAVKAVLSQGAYLVTLGQNVVGDMEGLVSSKIEQAVYKQPVSVKAVVPQAQPAPVTAAQQSA